MAPDRKPLIPAGPFWIWAYMDYRPLPAPASLNVEVEVTSQVNVTSYFSFFSLAANPYGAGNHYCHLLSPARAMEWLYTDALRE
jgi:hypothetical protein